MTASPTPVCPGCGKAQGSGSIYHRGGINGELIRNGQSSGMRVLVCGRCGWEEDAEHVQPRS